jgi:Protein of unknown function (DUF3592).
LKTKINKNKVLSFLFAGLGLLFFIIGIGIFTVLYINLVKLKENGIKTEGIISSINSSGDDTDVFITFKTNDGKEITTRINYYNSNMYVGEHIELYYDPINPNKVALLSGNFNLIFLLPFGAVGSVFFIIGIVFIKKNIAFEKKRDILILSGNYVIADIIEVNKNTNVTLLGKNPYIIHSHYSENGQDYFFKSHDIWFKPSYFLSKKVRIFLDRNDYTKYYVDEDSLEQN